jgi:hypothetical protein
MPLAAGETFAPPRPRMRLVAAEPRAEQPTAEGPALAPVPTLRQRVRVLRAADREPVLEAADEVHDEPAADAGATAVAIALAAIEALGGRRPLAQLARWLTPGVYEALRLRTSITARALGAAAGAGRHPAPRRVRACTVGAGVVEATVVVDDGTRVRAVALRLEAMRGAWRTTALEIG